MHAVGGEVHIVQGELVEAEVLLVPCAPREVPEGERRMQTVVCGAGARREPEAQRAVRERRREPEVREPRIDPEGREPGARELRRQRDVERAGA